MHIVESDRSGVSSSNLASLTIGPEYYTFEINFLPGTINFPVSEKKCTQPCFRLLSLEFVQGVLTVYMQPIITFDQFD
jgi:hypothetical protein